jgi:ribosomal protein S18 acetylase RimI-like enzyme
MDVEFLPASAKDEERLVEMLREFYAHERMEFAEPAARAALRGLLEEASRGSVLVIEVAGECAGYLAITFGWSLEFQGRDAFIDELWVRSRFRARGIGTRAIEVAAELCRAHGVRALHLEVERRNEAAKEIYRRAGFRDLDRQLMTRWLERAGDQRNASTTTKSMASRAR